MFENMEGKEEREKEDKYKKAQFEKNKDKFKNEEENQLIFVGFNILSLPNYISKIKDTVGFLFVPTKSLIL